MDSKGMELLLPFSTKNRNYLGQSAKSLQIEKKVINLQKKRDGQ
jgi:hypothetical protein